MMRTALLKLAGLCLILSNLPTALALSAAMELAEAIGLHPRDTLSCPGSTYKACGSNLPGNFCCPSSDTCIVFNNGQSVVCCPEGALCNAISPIDCNLSLQNATAHPTSSLFSTELSGTLQQCGSQCCPSGMACSNQNQCVIDSAATSTSSSTTSSATSSSSSSSPTSSASSTFASTTSTPSSTASSSSASQVAAAAATGNCNKFPASAVLAGFFPGLVLGVVLTVILICCVGLGRNRNNDDHRKSDDLSSVVATVSDPIYQPGPDDTFRSDFLRRDSRSRSRNRTSASSRVRSLFTRSGTIKSRTSPVDGIGRSIVPKTPSLRREPSTESIKIYSPPNGGLGRPNTTFTEMMREVGLKENVPYLGSPGRVDPRSRGVGGV